MISALVAAVLVTGCLFETHEAARTISAKELAVRASAASGSRVAWDPAWRKVAIVGAGPVGLFTALQLCKCGESCANAVRFIHFERRDAYTRDRSLQIWGKTKNLIKGRNMVPPRRGGIPTPINRLEQELLGYLEGCIASHDRVGTFDFGREIKRIRTAEDLKAFDLIIGTDGKKFRRPKHILGFPRATNHCGCARDPRSCCYFYS
jgi:hypothetical protein